MPASPRNSRKKSSEAARVTRLLLRRYPLPEPDGDEDKDARGRIIVVGGGISLPGAVVLAGIAALRAGAGKLQIATCRSIAPMVGVAVPESMCIGFDETREGTIEPSASADVIEYVRKCDALLIGPGMVESRSTNQFITRLLAANESIPVVADAGALPLLRKEPKTFHHLSGNAIITPHAGEMAAILGRDKDEIDGNPASIALEAAESLRAVVALKGSHTFVAAPDGDLFRYDSGDVGLATSGSGDTLAGVVAGLLARGADPLTATLWGVFLHGAAGNVLAKRLGRIGYLARELLDEIPPLMNR